jgi:hypothetical protein
MTKAYIFVLLFLIFISTSDLFSQASDMESMMPSPNKEESPINEKRKDRFGVNLILSETTSRNSNVDLNLSSFYGMGFGIFYEFYRNSIFSSQINLEYIQKGNESLFKERSFPEHETIYKAFNRMDYLSLPLFLIFPLYSKPFTQYLIAGVKFDYLVFLDSDYFEEYYQDLNKLFFRGTLGIGIEFDWNRYISLSPSILYDYDFGDTILHKYYTEDFRYKNQSFIFSLGVKIK